MASSTSPNRPNIKAGGLSDSTMTTSNPPSNPFPRSMQSSAEMRLVHDVCGYLKNYARERPDVAALWCFGIGFVVGWRLKPW